MAGEIGDAEQLPKRGVTVAMVESLIPDSRPYQGITVKALKPPSPVPGRLVVPGWDVWLLLEGDRELVGDKALSTSLQDWCKSKTGDLQAMVEAAATKLARRQAGRHSEGSAP